MAHGCSQGPDPRHRPNGHCGCPCKDCEIGSRNDLADELERIGREFDEKVKKLQEHYEQRIDQALKKLR